MITTEIPQTEWKDYCREFSRKHSGSPATVESFQYDGKHRILTNDNKKFEHVTIFPEKFHGEVAQIELGADSMGHQVITITGMSAMKVERTPEGTDAGLELHSKEHGILIIRFCSMFHRKVSPVKALMRRTPELRFASSYDCVLS